MKIVCAGAREDGIRPLQCSDIDEYLLDDVSTDFIYRQQENFVDNKKFQARFRPLCNKILFLHYDKVTYLSITIVTWGFEIRNKRNSGTIVTVYTRMSRVESHSQRTDVKESFPLESVSDVFAVSFHLMVPVSKREIIILKVL